MTPNKEAAQALKNFNNLIEADRLINELGSIVQGSHAHILIKRVIVDMAEAQTTTEALTDNGKAEGVEVYKAWSLLKAEREDEAFAVLDNAVRGKASQTPQTVDDEYTDEDAAHALAVLDKEELTYTTSMYGGDPDGCSDYDAEITVDLKSLLGDNVYETIRARLRAKALASRGLLGTVPDGWKLVPIEPTQEMLEAAYESVDTYEEMDQDLGMTVSYKAMLAASPQPKPQNEKG